MRKVCIDPGHGGRDPGAVFQSLQEKDVTLAVALSIPNKLSNEYEVYLTRTEDIDLGATKSEELQRRCETAINAGCDVFVSIHCNADPDPDEPGMPEAKGEEIWYRAASDSGYALAKSLQKWVDQIFPNEPFRGLKPTTSLYVLNGTYKHMASALIEIGFIDKSSSTETFTDPETIDKIGDLIARGINDYYDGVY